MTTSINGSEDVIETAFARIWKKSANKFNEANKNREKDKQEYIRDWNRSYYLFGYQMARIRELPSSSISHGKLVSSAAR
jgi:hypothetical protein